MTSMTIAQKTDTPEVFADGLGRIAFHSGVVRFELVSIELPESGEEAPNSAVVNQRVVLPLEGFLRAYQTMGELVQNLTKAGVIKPKTDT